MRQYTSLQRLTSVLLIISLLTSVFLTSFTVVTAEDEAERIPVGAELTAVLSTTGVLTLEGTGSSDDFTPETAPLAPYADRITAVVIPEGVTGLGDYLFYGCYNLTGTLTLPASLLELGDGCFSGADAAAAPHFTCIFNDFTSLEEVVTTPATSAPIVIVDPTDVMEPIEEEEPAPAEDENQTPAEDEQSAPAEDEQPVPAEDEQPAPVEDENQTPAEDENQTPAEDEQPVPAEDENQTPAEDEQPAPAEDEQPAPVEDEQPAPAEEEQPAPVEDEQPAPAEDEQTPTGNTILAAIFGTKVALAATADDVSAESEEPTPAETEEPAPAETEKPAPAETEEPAPAETEEPAPAETEEPTPAETEEPAPAETEEPTPAETEEPQVDYRVEVRTQQTVGNDVFYPAAAGGQAGLFLCAPENFTFLAAAEAAGYTLADGEITLYLLPGAGTGEAVSARALALNGQAVAPACPAFFAPATELGTFRGWLTAEGEQVYAPGDAFPVDMAAGEAILCACWSDELVLLAEGATVMFAPGTGSGTAAAMSCVDGEQTYARWPEDLGFAAPEKLYDADNQEIAAPGVTDSRYKTVIVFDGWLGDDGSTYDPGDLVPAGTTLTAQWAWGVAAYMSDIGADSQSRDYGHTLSQAMANFPGVYAGGQAPQDKYLNIIVVDTNAELRWSGRSIFNWNRTDTLPELPCTVTGTDPAAAAGSTGTLSMDSCSLDSEYIFTRLEAPMIIRDIALSAGHDNMMQYSSFTRENYFDAFYAACNKLIMGNGITVAGTLNIFGGTGGGIGTSAINGSSQVAIFSGNYQRVYGGSFRVSMTGGNRDLHFLGGSANYLFGGGYQKGNSTSGLSSVYMAGGTINNDLVASSDEGTVNGDAKLTMVGGSVTGSVFGGLSGVEDSGSAMTGSTFVTVYQGSVGGNIYGGGNVASLTGNPTIDIRGGTVSGNVYGGGNKAELTGNTAVTVQGGTVQGNVYGGGYSETAAVTGDTAVSVSGGLVTGNVYGGGDQAVVQNVITDAGDDAGAGGSTKVEVSGGDIAGNIYGGGQGLQINEDITDDIIGAVARSATVSISGGTVGKESIDGSVANGNVYGGGSLGTIGMEGRGFNADANTVLTNVLISGGRILGSVYGGSYCGKVGLGTFNTDETAVITNPVGGSATVTVAQTSFISGDVFGGGSGVGSGKGLGAVFGSSTVNISGGRIGLRVFGGSSMARITGDTAVNITSDTGAVTVEKTIYGGCNGQGTTFNEEKFLVFGDSSVNVEQTAGDVTIGGSIFGSGNLTRVSGTRTLNVKNLSGEIDSLQRADTVTIENCNLTLTGATDKVDGTNLDFSIAQVRGEVRLVKSQLTANTELNEVANFGSYKEDGATPAEQADGNVLTIQAGKLLIIGTKVISNGTQTMTYGEVKGVTTLRWVGSEGDTEDHGVFIHANTQSDIGDPDGMDENGVQINTGAFVADPDQTMPEGLSLHSGATASYHYWQLGGRTVKTRVVMQLKDTTPDANGYYQDTLTFPLPLSVRKDTVFVPVDPNLEQFTPILTKDLAPVTAGSPQAQALSMYVLQNDDLWHDKMHYINIVNKTNADGTVDPNVGEIIYQHTQPHYPVTKVEGLPYFTFDLSYSNRTMAGGTICITLLAHEKSEPETSDSRGRFTIEVEIQGQGEGTSTGRAKAGRQYGTFYSPDLTTPTVAPNGAITVETVLNYTPILTEGDAAERFPQISVKNASTGEVVTTPIRILMADLTYPANPRWYVKSGGMNGTIRATDLINVRGRGPWQPPLQNQPVVDKSLLFLLDFRDSGLDPGEYYFSLEFPTGSCATCEVPFKLADLPEDGAMSWSDTTLTVTAPSGDWDYMDGSLIRLTGLSGAAAGEVAAANTGGTKLDLIVGDGAVFLPLTQLTQGKTAAVKWDFAAPDESTTVKAELFPLPICQSGSIKAASAAAPDLALTASGGGEAVSYGRGMVAKPAAGASQLVDSAAGGSLEFRITPDQPPADGESIVLTAVKRKTGTKPEDASYTDFVTSGWTYTMSADGLSGELILPAGMTPGTYRVYFELRQGTAPLAQCHFNFIVT